jgi:2'-5' RNA ligase
MRLFVGIDLGARLLTAIEEDVALLRSTLHRICPRLPARWVSRANLHLTLVFVGHVADTHAAALTAALETPFSVRPFDLKIGGFGTFPPSGPLQVIWMGIVAGGHQLSLLHGQIAERLLSTGRPAETRPYAPHLTVARVKDARGASARAAREAVQKTAARGGLTRIEEITLFQSHQTAAGSVYDRLLRIPLLK